MKRRSGFFAGTALFAAVAGLAGSLAVPASANHDGKRFHLTVASHGLFTTADPGTYCYFSPPDDEGGGFGECSDAAYPSSPPRARLPIHPGGSARLVTNFRADGVEVTPVRFPHRTDDVRFGTTKKASPANDERRRWHVRLPRRLADRTRGLDVQIDYTTRGDANFLAGVEVHHHVR